MVMVTDIDHVEALRKRLIDKQHAKEAELAEIQEMIRVLGDAPKVLAGGRPELRQERSQEKPARYNLELGKQVADYIAKLPDDTVINRRDMIEKLKQEYGVKGKDKSLYAYISALLAKIASNKSNELFVRYKKDVGFYKSRNNDKTDSILVATI